MINFSKSCVRVRASDILTRTRTLLLLNPNPSPNPNPNPLHPGTLHPEKTYSLFTSDGSKKEFKGLYAIVDGGYHEWRCLMAPLKQTLEADAAEWSKRLESVRKNVECTFGILKKRFRILRLPFLKHNPEHIDDVFRACCALHNILLKHDDLNSLGRKTSDWVPAKEMMRRDRLDASRSKTVTRAPHRVCTGTRENGFDELREALITHMAHARKVRALKWLRTAADARPRNQRPHQDQGEEDEGEVEAEEEVDWISPDEDDSDDQA